jgi:predicted RNA-binding protein Jag
VAAAHDGVNSYSEGEAPRRYVVLSLSDASEEEE